MATIARLPAELFSLVVAYCGREDLKALRLTTHALSDIATRKLLEEMHISPNSASFARAHCISQETHLSQHIRSLIYHFGKLADVYAGFDSFKYEYYSTRQSQPAYDPYELNAEVLWNYNCWLEELDAQRTFDLRDEAEELRDLCSSLPQLEAISTRLDEANVFGDQDDYIGKRTGMAAIEDDGEFRFSRLFAAAVDKPLRKISARCIQWQDLEFMEDCDHINIAATQDCLNKLDFLEIGIYRAPLDLDNEPESERQERLHRVNLFDSVLRHARSLQTLRLDFDELPFQSEPQETLPVSRAIFSHHWPRLQDLKLEALCVDDEELCDFLFSHHTTLTSLCLGDIELLSREDGVPSVLSLFVRLHGFLRLRTCKITGNFTNRINQGWYVDTEHKQPGCLRDQLEEFLRGTTTSSHSNAINNHGQDDPGNTDGSLKSWLHKIEGQYEAFEDGSWQWAPELLPTTPDLSPILSPMP